MKADTWEAEARADAESIGRALARNASAGELRLRRDLRLKYAIEARVGDDPRWRRWRRVI